MIIFDRLSSKLVTGAVLNVSPQLISLLLIEALRLNDNTKMNFERTLRAEIMQGSSRALND